MSFDSGNCINCKYCINVCKRHLLNGEKWDSLNCDHCKMCEKGCPTNARRFIGEVLTVDEVFHRAIKDIAFFETSKGGITFSGGEPLMQPDFAEELAKKIKLHGINSAIETCGFAAWKDAEKVLRYMDMILYDIKHMDSDAHKRLTGVPNQVILKNAVKASKLGIPMIIRMPVIGGYNSDEENISKTIDFAKKIGAREIHFLKYHRFGEAKYKKIRRIYDEKGAKTLSDEEMNALVILAKNQGLQARIDG